MSFYGTYTPLRTSVKSGNYGLSTHNTLPARSSHSDRSPGRTKSGSQYLSPYSTAWGSRDSSRTSSYYSSTAERHTPRITLSKSSRDSSYTRPHSYLGWTSSQDRYYRSPSPNYKLSDYGYMQDRSIDYKKSRAHSPDFRSRSYTSRNTVWTDLSMRYQKSPKYVAKIPEDYTRSYRTDTGSTRYAFGDPTAPDLTGWRARLARQGYVASTVKKKTVLVPDRLWQYLDEDESEESENAFEYRTSRATCDESDAHLNSVISRTKRMKLQKMSYVPSTSEIEIQIDAADFQKYQELEGKRLKRSFISSRHRPFYDIGTVSYNKYLSPMPWKGSSNYSSQRWSRRKASEDEPTEKSQPAMRQLETPNKDFRKSALNVDLTETEAEMFSRKQAETRWRRTTLDICSDDGSPSETGYESHSSFTDVDADRSSGEAESLFTDSMDRSYTELQDSYRSARSTPFGDDVLCLEGAESRMSCLTDSQIPFSIFSPDPDIINLCEKDIQCYRESMQEDLIENENIKDLCFRFKSANETASQRDSGFSEVYNIYDSPRESICLDSDVEVPYVESEHENAIEEQKYIGKFKDIDELLRDRDLDQSAFETFEDFERRINRQQSNIRTKQVQANSTPSSWSKPSKDGLRLDLNKSKFIGPCTDIDEMLGKPSPITPDDQSEWNISVIIEETSTEEEDGASTAATSIIGSIDVADISCFNDFDQLKIRERLSCPEIWSRNHHLEKEEQIAKVISIKFN